MASVLSPQDVPESARKHYTAIGLAEQRIFERRQDCQANVEPQQGKTAKTMVVDWENSMEWKAILAISLQTHLCSIRLSCLRPKTWTIRNYVPVDRPSLYLILFLHLFSNMHFSSNIAADTCSSTHLCVDDVESRLQVPTVSIGHMRAWRHAIGNEVHGMMRTGSFVIHVGTI